MTGLRYVWSAGMEGVMHIGAGYDQRTGEPLFAPLCGSTKRPWNRTINAPFGLGRKVCGNCRRVAARTTA